MEHMNYKLKCYSLSEGMWLLMAATVAVCSCSSAYIQPSPASKESTLYETSHSEIITENAKGGAEDGSNVTHTYRDGLSSIDPNNTSPEFVSTNTLNEISDSTSPILSSLCGPCTSLEEYNLTDANGTALNSTSFLLSSVTRAQAPPGFFNLGVIIGISVLVAFILILFGVLGYFGYRHFSWNRPQTLTDKFSNDESTGYIDDTAFRENSEELYSLDNDSFLNSLEAMTIQNYWTDHVKHTKL